MDGSGKNRRETYVSELHLEAAGRPTMYFIGVSTSQSMIMKVFPAWARRLGFGDCAIKGIDLALHDLPRRYREVVQFIRDDPCSLGALVTTHKIDLYAAARDLFDQIDDSAALMGEVSSISRQDGRLLGAARDAISSGLSVEAIVPPRHWEQTRADAFIMGAGGASVALCTYLARAVHGANRPARLFVSNRSKGRLDQMREIHRRQPPGIPVDYVLTPSPEENDAVMRKLSPCSLVVNGTGLGKDASGSPITDAAVFPKNGIAWDFNYRGDLLFLRQAGAQAQSRGLHSEDGWLYFIHGWLCVIGDVFHRDIPSQGTEFDELCRIADEERRKS